MLEGSGGLTYVREVQGFLGMKNLCTGGTRILRVAGFKKMERLQNHLYLRRLTQMITNFSDDLSFVSS